MKNLFKLSALAASIAVTVPALAGEVSVSSSNGAQAVYSTEFVKTRTDLTAQAGTFDVNYEMGAPFAEGDKLVLTFSGITLESGDYPSVAVFEKDEDGVTTKANLGFLSASGNTVTYRITGISATNNSDGTAAEVDDTIGATGTFSGFPYTYAELANAGTISVEINGETSNGDVIDNTGTLSAVAAQHVSQLGTASAGSKFSKVIDVASGRQAFTDETRTDSATINFDISVAGDCIDTDCTQTFDYALALGDFTPSATVYANLGQNSEAEGDIKSNVGIAATNSSAVAYDNQMISIDLNAGTTTSTVSLTNPTGDTAVALENQLFTYNAAVAYGSLTASVAESGALGSWTLNGANVLVPYMPYGPTASQIVYITNRSDQAGDISVTVIDDKGKKYELGVIGRANGGTVTKVAPLINERLNSIGFNSSKAAFEITVNAPDNAVTVFASYNVGGNSRNFVQTEKLNEEN